MRDVDLRTTVSRQGVIVDGKDTLVSIYASNQGVDKEEKQLCERDVRKGTCYHLSETALKCLKGTKYKWPTSRWSYYIADLYR